MPPCSPCVTRLRKAIQRESTQHNVGTWLNKCARELDAKQLKTLPDDLKPMILERIKLLAEKDKM